MCIWGTLHPLSPSRELEWQAVMMNSSTDTPASRLWGQALIICYRHGRAEVRGLFHCGMRIGECGMDERFNVQGLFHCGMRNSECGMDERFKVPRTYASGLASWNAIHRMSVRRYGGTKGRIQCGTPRGYPNAKCGISTDHVRRYEGTKAPSEMRSVRWRMGQLRCGARILNRAFTLTAAGIPPDPEGPSARLPLP